ncbi:Kinesin light chain 3 [Phlyctochytrium planicorne]|nr:Kinesin light chain 3 [Phlyctochytrium planicorne]
MGNNWSSLCFPEVVAGSASIGSQSQAPQQSDLDANDVVTESTDPKDFLAKIHPLSPIHLKDGSDGANTDGPEQQSPQLANPEAAILVPEDNDGDQQPLKPAEQVATLKTPAAVPEEFEDPEDRTKVAADTKNVASPPSDSTSTPKEAAPLAARSLTPLHLVGLSESQIKAAKAITVVETTETEQHIDHSSATTRGVRLSFFSEFIETYGGRDAFKGLTTTDVCVKFVAPLTSHSKLSAIHELESKGRTDVSAEADYFISHAWKYMFLDVVDALEEFFVNERRMDRDTTIVWFDLYTNSQHGTADRPFEWWESTFMSSVKKMGNVVMVLQPWENPIPFTRAWCVFEIYSCYLTNSNFHVAFSPGESEKFSEGLRNDPSTFFRIMNHISISKAESFIPTDRERILEVVDKLAKSDEFSGRDNLDRLILGVFQDWMERRIRSVLASLPEDQPLVKSMWMLTLATLLNYKGLQSMAMPYFAESLAIELKHRGEDGKHPSTLQAKFGVAIGIYRQGGPAAEHAIVLLEEVLKEYKTMYGPRDAKTIEAASRLGAVKLSVRKDLRETLEMLRKNFETAVEALGEESVGTLNCMYNLAHAEGANKNAVAPEMFRRCYEIRRRILGPDHIATLMAMNDWAFYRFQSLKDDSDTSELLEIEAIFTEAMIRGRRAFGEDHPMPRASKHGAFGVKGRLEASLDNESKLKFYESTVEAMKRTRGPEAVATIIAALSLAHLYFTTSKLESLKLVAQEFVPIAKQTLGPDSEYTVSLYMHLARAYMKEGQFAQGGKIAMEAIQYATSSAWRYENSKLGLYIVGMLVEHTYVDENVISIREMLVRWDEKNHYRVIAEDDLIKSYVRANRMQDANKQLVSLVETLRNFPVKNKDDEELVRRYLSTQKARVEDLKKMRAWTGGEIFPADDVPDGSSNTPQTENADSQQAQPTPKSDFDTTD